MATKPVSNEKLSYCHLLSFEKNNAKLSHTPNVQEN